MRPDHNAAVLPRIRHAHPASAAAPIAPRIDLNNPRGEEIVTEHAVDEREPERIERRAKERFAAHRPRAAGPTPRPRVVPLGVDDGDRKIRGTAKRGEVDQTNDEREKKREGHDRTERSGERGLLARERGVRRDVFAVLEDHGRVPGSLYLFARGSVNAAGRMSCNKRLSSRLPRFSRCGPNMAPRAFSRATLGAQPII